MDSNQLNDELQQLHLQLTGQMEQAEGLTPQNIESLRRIAADIQTLMQRRSTSQASVAGAAATIDVDPKEPQSGESADDWTADSLELPASIQTLANQFSVEHPQLADVMNRLGYLLSTIGI